MSFLASALSEAVTASTTGQVLSGIASGDSIATLIGNKIARGAYDKNKKKENPDISPSQNPFDLFSNPSTNIVDFLPTNSKSPFGAK